MTAGGTRADIQVLRAVAVLAVVLNHLAPSLLVGGFLGVDIFFVVSGYLISAHLLVALSRGGGRALLPFWLKRIRRLLPAATVVAALSVVGVFLWIPQSEWGTSFTEAIASMSYTQNWVLVATSTDYFASDSPTPFTHYWSLSVEEQFYVFWPLALLGALVIARGRDQAVVVVVAAITLLSLAFSAWYALVSPAEAYFNSLARVWQFGFGALAALYVARRGALAGRGAVALPWVGLALIVWSLVSLDGSLPLPGLVALIPVMGTVLVLVAGNDESPLSVTGLVGKRPIVAVGDISYSLYLWHWPLIVFYPWIVGSSLNAVGAVAVLVVSIVLAALTKWAVEDPVRHARVFVEGPPRLHLALVGASLVVVLVAFGGIALSEQLRSAAQQDLAAQSVGDCFAAAAMAPAADCENPHVIADGESAALLAAEDAAMVVDTGEICMQDPFGEELVTCGFGVPREDADTVVALVGDSHAAHWIGALETVALAEGWHVVQLLKSSCLGLADDSVVPNWRSDTAASCWAWSEALDEYLHEDRGIDVLLVAGITREYLQREGETTQPLGVETVLSTWNRWTNAGHRIVVLGDTPRWDIGDVPTCVVSAGSDDPCAVDASARWRDVYTLAAEQSGELNVHAVDMNDFFCDDTTCHVAVGGVVAITDGNHMTRTFSESLGPFLRDTLAPVIAEITSAGSRR